MACVFFIGKSKFELKFFFIERIRQYYYYYYLYKIEFLF